MKKIFLAIFATMAFLSPSVVYSQTFEESIGGDRYMFEVISDDNHEVAIAKGYLYGDAVIPSKVNYKGEEYTVTCIKTRAFDSNPMTSVKIPDTVQAIGGSIFSKCTRLKNAEIPTSVTYIHSQPFPSKNSLSGDKGKDVIESPQYNEKVFFYMPRHYQGTYVIPDGIETIMDGAFKSCPYLTSIKIPNSVKTIGDGAFVACPGLTSIELPENVTRIGEDAFTGNARNLKKFKIHVKDPSQIDVNDKMCPTQCILYVPRGSKAKYASAPYWSQFKSIIEF